MYHYYLTPDDPQRPQTIYVVDMSDRTARTDESYLTERFGCRRITRQTALDIDRTYRLTVGYPVWFQKNSMTPDLMLNENLVNSSVATRELLDRLEEVDDWPYIRPKESDAEQFFRILVTVGLLLRFGNQIVAEPGSDVDSVLQSILRDLKTPARPGDDNG